MPSTVAGGWSLASSETFLGATLIVLRTFLIFEFVITILAPLLRATQGAPPNLTRFLLLPVPARFLYLGEALYVFGVMMIGFSAVSLLLFAITMVLMLERIDMEEIKMSTQADYRGYSLRVRYRLVP